MGATDAFPQLFAVICKPLRSPTDYTILNADPLQLKRGTPPERQRSRFTLAVRAKSRVAGLFAYNFLKFQHFFRSKKKQKILQT